MVPRPRPGFRHAALVGLTTTRGFTRNLKMGGGEKLTFVSATRGPMSRDPQRTGATKRVQPIEGHLRRSGLRRLKDVR